MMDDNDLKLIFIHKIGYNTKNEGLFEFVFSTDITNIDYETWRWDMSPACDNAEPPDIDYTDRIVSLKTKKFDLFCLHEAVDREYMQGYYTIHALAYETQPDDNINDYESMFEDDGEKFPLLVFHYGYSLEKIKGMLDERNIILRGDEFIEAESIKF